MSSVNSANSPAPGKRAPPNRQTRRFRTGCKTCKARRIQCDETKPECNACVDKGRVCPGYQKELKWSTKHELATSNAGCHDRPSKMRNVKFMTPRSVTDTSGPQLQPTQPDARLTEQQPASSEPVNTPPETYSLENRSSSKAPETINDPDPWADLYSQIGLDNLGLLPEANQIEIPADILNEYENGQALGEDGYFHSDGSTPNMENSLQMSMAFITPDVLQLSHYFPELLGDRIESEPEEQVPNHRVSPPLIDMPTFLIEYWFKNICSMWSGYDSDNNLNRQLASSTWTHDRSVFHCLQAMSAFHLAEQLPHLSEAARTSWKSAVQAIHSSLSTFTQKGPSELPIGLLLSLSGIGTTTCWTDSQQLGVPLLKKMKRVLAYYNQSAMQMSVADRIYLEFFNDSCAYWEILCRIVADDDGVVGPSPRLSRPNTPRGTHPHPWVGVSRDIFELFSNAILLCKRYCRKMKMSDYQNTTAHSLRDIIRDIDEARALRRILVNIKKPSAAGMFETGDKVTPLNHLVDVAEGYRLAALLHLYQTFKDLEEDYESENGTLEETWIQQLALQLLELVGRIPLESGSRCIQPLLYLSIATGLKNCPPAMPNRSGGRPSSASSLGINSNLPPELISGPAWLNISGTQVTKMTLKIGQARRVVMQRVSVLEYSLPAKPITVLKALIKRIWEVWDGEMCSASRKRTHWIEVMEESRLRTIFG
ncbi:hypothetical protein BO78DRAFT_446145 [Aspergillus sclerotiicarbonarius CBS 121057]|uniref:Zn(2)-C6 fungal-type domain-containing protein n=1 Tax=Aspergillus sclerotiicarbonarius (strain CBS 121057 / IBT 28362) TaxID=1448318 RepID=A0A319EPI2_ASPSB|nr:hypothetical protein BO78DRAFT_446145 [Aspergillus sclerotiicarbonarius CBS 121057]